MDLVIAFGANLGEREKNILHAQSILAEHVGPLVNASKLIQTVPLVLPGQDLENVPPYINCVALYSSSVLPMAILAAARHVERELGRTRERELLRWQSRVIDIDIIALGEVVFKNHSLTIPHAEMHKRDFVLEPMQEVLPNWTHPILKKTPAELLESLLGDKNKIRAND